MSYCERPDEKTSNLRPECATSRNAKSITRSFHRAPTPPWNTRNPRRRASTTRKLREVKEIFRNWKGESALAFVTGALEQFPLLVLAHLLAPLFDHTTHG
jgi:hypothetical protein